MSKYANTKFYQNKLNNIMKKINAEKFKFQYTKDSAFVNFKLNYKWYQINHTLKNAKKTDPDINTGYDVFAQLVLALEDLTKVADKNICKFDDLIAVFELKAGAVELPECFIKFGFDGRYLPSKKNVDYKYNELVRVLDPDKNAFGDAQKLKELQEAKEACYKYLEENKSE